MTIKINKNNLLIIGKSLSYSVAKNFFTKEEKEIVQSTCMAITKQITKECSPADILSYHEDIIKRVWKS